MTCVNAEPPPGIFTCSLDADSKGRDMRDRPIDDAGDFVKVLLVAAILTALLVMVVNTLVGLSTV